MKKTMITVLLVLLALGVMGCAAPKDSSEINAGMAQYTTNASADVTEETVEKETTNSITTTEGSDKTEATQKSDETGIRPEFKKAMEDYEVFYNEYCDFMKKYQENPTDLSLLGKYADMLAKSVEVSEAFEKWDQNEMNKEEVSYYIDVNARVLKKLAEVTN